VSTDPLRLIERHRSKGVLIDTNILVLLVVGAFDTKAIGNHKRTKKFSSDDYAAAKLVVEHCGKVFTTPNILTEVSNLASQTSEPMKLGILAGLAAGIATLNELYHTSNDLRQMDEFIRYGLTDVGILRAAREGYLVFTDDLRLYGYLESQGLPAINIAHFQYWV